MQASVATAAASVTSSLFISAWSGTTPLLQGREFTLLNDIKKSFNRFIVGNRVLSPTLIYSRIISDASTSLIACPFDKEHTDSF